MAQEPEQQEKDAGQDKKGKSGWPAALGRGVRDNAALIAAILALVGILITQIVSGADLSNGVLSDADLSDGDDTDESGANLLAADLIEEIEEDLETSQSILLYDEMSRYPNGTLGGKVPLVGPTWNVTGSSPTVIQDGKAISNNTGYAGMILPDTPSYIGADLTFTGDPTINSMTLCTATDSSWAQIQNIVHLDYGPSGFRLTVRENSGSFEQVARGSWKQQMKADGVTVYHVGYSVQGNTITIYGPSGEQNIITDPQIGLLHGPNVFWEPNTNSSIAASAQMVAAVAIGSASSGKV